MTAATILIVDDELQNRKLLEALLKPEGYFTQSAANGEDALASIAQSAPDLILLDIMMPGMDGYQVATTLKANPITANIPVIMVTAQIGRSARLAGLDAGAEDFLTKPVDRAELWLRVRNLLRLKELGDFFQNHSAILEQQVQERTAELQLFRTAMDATADAIFLVNRATMNFVEVNATACNMLGYTHEELLQLGPAQISDATLERLESVYDAIIADRGENKITEFHVRRKDGSYLLVETDQHAYRSGADWIMVGVLRDITERKKAEARIVYLNRVYAVLSGINTLIVHAHDRDELFREACRIAVETGEFLSADILMVDVTSKQATLAASSSSDARYLEALRKATVNRTPDAQAFRARFYNQRQPLVFNDIENDVPVSLQDSDRLANSRSACVLPLVIADRTVGLLTLRAREADFFDAEEMKLLLELAGDIAFAIDHLEKADKLSYLAYYDVLTGLANQHLFLDRVTQFIHSAVDGEHKLALCLFDLERFKNINDSLGQAAGDALLKQVAEWLTRKVGDAGLLARVGADHFAVVLPQVKSGSGLARNIETGLETLMSHPFHLDDAVFRVAAKAGIALFPEDGVDAITLFRNAEAALKKAKTRGDRYLFHTQSMTAAVGTKLTLENQLRQALENGEFVLHYQPKVSLMSGKVTGAEALIRWNDPRTGLVPPGRFIPVLEETGLIYEVGRWALHQAIKDYLHWRNAGLAAMRVAVNVSPLQLRHRGFVAEIGQAIAIDAQAAAGLELEITESLIMEDVKHSIASLQAIRDMDVSIAIDDFGTGFSSLSYLAKLPVDTLKIDRSFVIDMTASPEGLALVSTIISLAHALTLKVVAEGVETEEQSRLLRLLKCDEMQGYLFSKPVPVDVFETRYLAALPT